MFARDSESRGFEQEIGLSFYQVDVGPTSNIGPRFALFGLFQRFGPFFLNVPKESVFETILGGIFEL